MASTRMAERACKAAARWGSGAGMAMSAAGAWQLALSGGGASFC
jgi:hypothetical protein